MSACDASPGPCRREEAWERLLGLEREVRELRQILLADIWHEADGVRTPDLDVAPTSITARSARLADWQVTCLGPFRLQCGGRRPVPCSSRRGWGILQYMLVRPSYAAARHVLIETFWPGTEPLAGAHSLQMAIHALRRSLRGCGPGGNDETIVFRDGQYGINPDLTIELDVDNFRAACERGRRLADASQVDGARRAFEEALALYGGQFLFESGHDEWAEPQRAALQELRLDVLGWLSGTYAAQAEWEQAAACCREILAADPYREDAIRQLLLCLAETGWLAEVERTFRACRERLWQDLQVEPALETIRLYRQLTGAAAPRSAVSGS